MALRWLAQYNDGTQLAQVDEDGTKHAYSDIDRSKLLYFKIHSTFMPVFTVIFDDDGDKLVWTRRTYHRVGDEPLTVHIAGKKGEFIAAIYPDGGIAVRHNYVNDGVFDEVIQ